MKTAFISVLVFCLGNEISAQDKADREALSRLGAKFLEVDGRCVEVEIASDQVKDDHLLVVGKYTNLELLSLDRCKITDKGLTHLQDLSNLRSLIMRGIPHLQGVGLNSLVGKTKKLENLVLTDCPISDEGLAAIVSFPLVSVRLRGTKVTDKGMVHLAKIKSLEHVALFRASVSSEGVKHLRRLDRLKSLTLTETQIDDECCVDIAAFKDLSSLHLAHTKISDRSVDVLAKIHTLRFLNIQGTSITPDGFAKLKSAIPKAFVSYSTRKTP